jgi:hypothetical protein
MASARASATRASQMMQHGVSIGSRLIRTEVAREAVLGSGARRVATVLLLPGLLGISVVVAVGLSNVSFSARSGGGGGPTILRADLAAKGVPTGASANFYWTCAALTPLLVSLFFFATLVQASAVARTHFNTSLSSSRAHSRTSKADVERNAESQKSLLQDGGGSDDDAGASGDASGEDALEVALRVTWPEMAHVLVVLGYAIAFVVVAFIAHPSNPLMALVSPIQIASLSLLLSLVVAVAVLVMRLLRTTILRRERQNAIRHIEEVQRRARNVVLLQLFAFMHVMMYAFSAPPLLQPVAFSAGTPSHEAGSSPCLLLNSSYMERYCGPSLQFAQEVGRDLLCDDGGFVDYRSAHDACLAEGLASMLRARAYATCLVSANALLYLVFSEFLHGARGGLGGLPTAALPPACLCPCSRCAVRPGRPVC